MLSIKTWHSRALECYGFEGIDMNTKAVDGSGEVVNSVPPPVRSHVRPETSLVSDAAPPAADAPSSPASTPAICYLRVTVTEWRSLVVAAKHLPWQGDRRALDKWQRCRVYVRDQQATRRKGSQTFHELRLFEFWNQRAPVNDPVWLCLLLLHRTCGKYWKGACNSNHLVVGLGLQPSQITFHARCATDRSVHVEITSVFSVSCVWPIRTTWAAAVPSSGAWTDSFQTGLDSELEPTQKGSRNMIMSKHPQTGRLSLQLEMGPSKLSLEARLCLISGPS